MRWLAIGLSLLAGSGFAMSSDCHNEKTQVLEIVCNTKSLSTMDDVIQVLYEQNLTLAGSESLKAEQEAWLAQRDQGCLDKESCEDVMINRINQLLVHLTERRVTNLQKGMELPQENLLDNYSKDALKLVGQEHYHPWKRRAVLKSGVEVFEPIATVLGDEVFVFFKTYTATFKQEIHELNLMTMQEYIVASGDEYNMAIKDNHLFFTMVPEKQNTQLYSYAVGSKMYPTKAGKVSSDEYLTMMGHSDRNRRWALSHDGTKLAVITSEIKSMENDQLLSAKVTEYLKRISEKLDPTMQDNRTIVVYDSIKDQLQIMPDILDGSKERVWWRIYDMTWTKDDSQIYFDNEGQRLACIWQYDLSAKQVTKIVPEHTAITPYPIVYKGKAYIVYVLAHGGYEGRLMLATSPQ